MLIKDITNAIEDFAPLAFQESYDNAGLLIGEPDRETKKALITLDVTEEVIEEAISENCDLVIAHHPIIFNGIKKLNAENPVERIIRTCIKKDISVYAAHTNLDNVGNGVNKLICEKIGLKDTSVLQPKTGLLRKLVTFCPADHANKVRDAIFEAGAGFIGNYDCCSFNTAGRGSFRALEGTNPFVGEKNNLHFEDEIRIESIYPEYKESMILDALLTTHPYEEVAYDIYPLGNMYFKIGSGMVGMLQKDENFSDFLSRIKKIFGSNCIRHTKAVRNKIRKVAVCGGSGIFLLQNAIHAGADIFITADVKYHDFFETNGKIIIADVGHFESEQFTRELLINIIKNKFPIFAVQISKINTNPIFYY